MHKPNRHTNHILETESNKFFCNSIPNEWFIDKPDHDYGIDFIVNISVRNQVTGLNFSVQLKSKAKENYPTYTTAILKKTTLEMFKTRLEPVLLVVYVQEELEAYWFWYNELVIDSDKVQKSLQIRIPKTNKLSCIDWDSKIKYVQQSFSVKNLIIGIKELEYETLSNSELLAWKHFYSEEFEEAIFYFKNLIKSNPKSVHYIEALSYCLYMNYDYHEAILTINKSIYLAESPNQFIIKACILAEDGIKNNIKERVLEARNIFRKYIDKGEYQDSHFYNYANTLSYLDDHNEAIIYYEKCLKLNPRNEKAWKNMGQIYYTLQQHKKELSCYDKALSINPNLQEALFSKGVTLSRIYEKHKEGLKLMIQVTNGTNNLTKSYPYIFFSIAYAYENSDDIEKALQWLNQGLELYPKDPYYINYKTTFFQKHWAISEKLKEQALEYYNYRVDLNKDPVGLFMCIKIKEIVSEKEIYDILQDRMDLFKNLNLETIHNLEIKLFDQIDFLLYYNAYLQMRESNSIYRYSDHLISSLFSVSKEFWSMLDFLFSISFSKAISSYIDSRNHHVRIPEIILENMTKSTCILPLLIQDGENSQEAAIEIMAQIYLSFPIILQRELGVQIGTIQKYCNIDVDLLDLLPNSWNDQLGEQTLININRKLNLLRED